MTAVLTRTRARLRMPALLGALLAVALAALWPGVAWAGCGVTDFSACADDAQYTIWYGVATFLWAIDAMLLQLAYLVDVLRVWVVETAFTSAYQALITLVSPLIVPFATLALIIAVLLFLLTPMFGRIRAMNVRHVLVWALLAPVLLTVSGPLIVEVEQARTSLGAAIFTDVSAITPGAIFGVSSSDMRQPTPLYGGNPCGTGALARPGLATNPAALHMDDLAAAMLWADAQDIHCPRFSGPGQDVPDMFYLDAPDGPGFATTNKVGDMNDSSERATAILDIQRGATRLALGVIPGMLAVLEMLINLVFGLALIALWLGLPLGLAFIFFEESSASIAMLLRQGFGVLKVSWASAFLMAILFAALKSSAEMGNAAAYTGLAGGAILLMGWLLLTAFATLSSSVHALSSSLMAGTGLNVLQPAELVAGGAGLAAGALSGGATIAAVAAAAYQQTGSARYAAGAAAGRVGKIAQLGEVAAAMGSLQDEEVVAGLHAGARSTQSYRSMRLQMVMDAKRTGDDGLTIRERAQERSLTHQIDAATDPGVWRSLNEGATAAGAAVGGGYRYVSSGQGFRDARASGGRMLERIGDRWHRAQQDAAAFGAEVDARVNTPGPSALGELGMLTRSAAATLAVAHDQLRPDGRYAGYRLDANGQIRRLAQQNAAAPLPPAALTVPSADANLPRLLRLGYAVQQNADQTVTIWPTDPQQAEATPEQQRAQLQQDGALRTAAIARAAADGGASGMPPAGAPAQRLSAGIPALSPREMESLSAPTQPGAAVVAGQVSTVPASPSRVERLAARRSAPTVPASSASSASPPTISQVAGVAAHSLGAAPTARTEAEPAASTGASQPAVLPAPAARWLEQVQRQPPRAALTPPAAPVQPAHLVDQEVSQAPETTASIPAAGAAATAQGASEK